MIGWAVAKGAWAVFKASPIARLIGKIAGVALLILSFGAYKKRQGAQGAKAKQAEAALKKTVKGAEDARKGRAEATEKLRQGQSPEEIVRGNDDDWS